MICKYKQCKIMASFNYKGEDKRIYCSKHKLKHMENVRYKFCAFDSCRKTKMKGKKTCKKHCIVDDEITVYSTILLSFRREEFIW